MTNSHSRRQHNIKTFVYTGILILAGGLNPAQADNLQPATLQGRILYRGLIPPPEQHIITQDVETCGATFQIRPITISDDGGLVQVVVSVEGLSGTPLSSKQAPVIISNDRCQFRPHVAVGSVKQPLEVENFDAILHNTHIRAETRAFFNVVLLPQSKGIKKVMKNPGLMTISCNKHPFMMGYIQVFDHPYFAITDFQGAFTIPNLPPGTHRLSIWHETLGTIHRTITIPQTNNAILNIEFPAP
ncbi:MAG: hypothetical protein OEZ41_05570 [Nitrospirota bacterium]|nr:hypothetical protein [Nitrospirota bacterium]